MQAESLFKLDCYFSSASLKFRLVLYWYNNSPTRQDQLPVQHLETFVERELTSGKTDRDLATSLVNYKRAAIIIRNLG